MPPYRSSRLLATALCTTLAIASGPAFATDAPEAIVAKLQPAAGWTAPEPARVAVGTGLFELIDGGAELYHEFGFKRAAAWSLETAERSSIQIELYEMTDAAAAYGVWSMMQTGTYTRGTLGHGSLRFGYYVAFWSGAYFASVTGARPDTATQAEVDRLAAQLAALLPSDRWAPASLLRILLGVHPQDPHPKYFRGRIGLSNIATPALLELFAPSEGTVLEHPDGLSISLWFASEEEARRHFAEALEKVRGASALSELHVADDEFSGLASDGHPFAAKRKGRYVHVSTLPERPHVPADQRLYR